MLELAIAISVPILLFIFSKIFKRSYKIGIFEFSIRLSGYAELEKENEELRQQLECAKMKAIVKEILEEEESNEKAN